MFIIQVTPNNFNFQLDCLSKMHATFCARIVAYHHLSTNFLPLFFFFKKKDLKVILQIMKNRQLLLGWVMNHEYQQLLSIFLFSDSGLIFNLCRKVFPNIILFLFILKICLPFTLLDGSITFGFKLAEVRPILINYIRQIAAYCIQITIFISMLCNTID